MKSASIKPSRYRRGFKSPTPYKKKVKVKVVAPKASAIVPIFAELVKKGSKSLPARQIDELRIRHGQRNTKINLDYAKKEKEAFKALLSETAVKYTKDFARSVIQHVRPGSSVMQAPSLPSVGNVPHYESHPGEKSSVITQEN